MSALRDLNTIHGERKNESCTKGVVTKPFAGNATENHEECQKQNSVPLTAPSTNGEEAEKAVEVATIEVEYVESENLDDVEDVDSSLETFLTGLESKDWVLLCGALNTVRQLAIFHKEAMSEKLEDMIPLLVKSLKNPRSAVCKTALMTSADIFKAYSDSIVDSLDPLLLQLLLKSSQDKRFVCEAAERALVAMTTWVSPTLLLPMLQPYLKHKNPRIRAKASMCFCRSVPRLGVEGTQAYGIDKLIQVAASQLSDQLPESREAARKLLLELQTVYGKFQNPSPAAEPVSEEVQSDVDSWENFCQSKLSPLSAQAVLRVTNISREGLVVGSS